jgi:hypothetical protein
MQQVGGVRSGRPGHGRQPLHQRPDPSIAPAIGRGVSQLDPGAVQQLLTKLHLGSPSELVGALAYIGGFRRVPRTPSWSVSS